MESIPLIDFSALSTTISDDALDVEAIQRTSDLLTSAFTKIGFAYLSNTGFPESLIERINAVSQAFFDLQTDVKLRYKFDHSRNDYFGYIPQELEHLGSSPGDLKECFHVQLRRFDDDSRWPNEVADFRETTLEFYKRCSQVSERVLLAIARGLHLSDLNFFKRCHNFDRSESGTTLRMLYYPPIPNELEVKPDQVRLGEHTDYGSCTLLMQGNYGGLQVKRRDGLWVDASPIPDTVLVNIGDLIQRWTSDRLISTPHRVLLTPDERTRQQVRRSTVFFAHPDPDFIVAPLDGSDMYPPTTDRAYLRQRFDATYH